MLTELFNESGIAWGTLSKVTDLDQHRLLCNLEVEFSGSGLPISAGAAILETVHHNGCNDAFCHAQMYTMGGGK